MCVQLVQPLSQRRPLSCAGLLAEAQQRAEAEQEERQKRVAYAFELAFGRPASRQDIELGLGFVSKNGLAAFCRVLFNANEFLYLN